MKKTLSVGILFFVIGGLVGVGMGKLWWRNAPAVSETDEASNIAELNSAGAVFPQGSDTQPSDQTAPREKVGEPIRLDTATLPEPKPEPVTQSPEPAIMIGESNKVSAGDQAPGMRVTLTTAILEHAGWAAIHESRDGKPGNILGAQRLDGGAHANVTVDLLRATTADGIYYVMLHGESADRSFDYKVDLPLTDATGAPIMTRFTTTAQ